MDGAMISLMGAVVIMNMNMNWNSSHLPQLKPPNTMYICKTSCAPEKSYCISHDK